MWQFSACILLHSVLCVFVFYSLLLFILLHFTVVHLTYAVKYFLFIYIEQFWKRWVLGIGLGFVFVHLFMFSICVFFFWFRLHYFVLLLFAFVVIGLVSSVLHQEIGWEERLQSDLFCFEWDVKPWLNQLNYLFRKKTSGDNCSMLYRLNAVPAQATVWKHWIELRLVDPAKKSSRPWLRLFLIHQQTHG